MVYGEIDMPDTRQHRGAHPSDIKLFDASKLSILRTATSELSWLVSRGYAITSALKLVGDRHGLNKRQRVALSRAVCADQSRMERSAKCLAVDHIKGEELIIDGFNLLITIEAALAGAVILICRDGCTRDISSVHGSYRTVLETSQAILLIGNVLETLTPQSVEWLFDQPVSNSGRLAQKMRTEAAEHGWPWNVTVTFNPDTAISASEKIAISSDSSILDKVSRWMNFSAYLIAEYLPQAWLIDLRDEVV